MELVTQIVILATALVGLYKAATFHSAQKEGDGNQVNGKSSISSTFADLFELVGILLFMLAFPAFIWAFSWVVGNVGNGFSSGSSVIENTEILVTKDSSDAEMMFVAAIALNSSSQKNSALVKVVDFAVAQKEYSVAIMAANEMSSSSRINENLEKIITSIAAQEGASGKN
ncbi:hypothetical protein WMQ26_07865 [Vibrio diabolicus]|uniref:hypothetical protein n=1 Tax=Vibrio diabolicus TaxID=50719 RepID=UPI0037527534